MTVITVNFGNSWQRNFNRRHHLDHVSQTHGISKPTHGLLGIPAALSITGLIIMCLCEQSQPTETTCLHHRQIKLGWLGVGDALAFLLNQKLKP
jgi:hypothetical protein